MRFALITYSTNVRLIFSFSRYTTKALVLDAISTTQYVSGSTNTAEALAAAEEMFSSPAYGDRSDAENVAILLTDGQSNIFPENTIPSANRLKATGTKVIAIGIGLTNYDEISQIASGPKDVFKVQGFDVLGDVKAEIIGSSCSAAEPRVEVPREEEIFEN